MEEKVNQMPRIGDLAPDFEAVTTHGKINFQITTREAGLYYLATLQTLHQFAQPK